MVGNDICKRNKNLGCPVIEKCVEKYMESFKFLGNFSMDKREQIIHSKELCQKSANEEKLKA